MEYPATEAVSTLATSTTPAFELAELLARVAVATAEDDWGDATGGGGGGGGGSGDSGGEWKVAERGNDSAGVRPPPPQPLQPQPQQPPMQRPQDGSWHQLWDVSGGPASIGHHHRRLASNAESVFSVNAMERHGGQLGVAKLAGDMDGGGLWPAAMVSAGCRDRSAAEEGLSVNATYPVDVHHRSVDDALTASQNPLSEVNGYRSGSPLESLRGVLQHRGPSSTAQPPGLLGRSHSWDGEALPLGSTSGATGVVPLLASSVFFNEGLVAAAPERAAAKEVRGAPLGSADARHTDGAYHPPQPQPLTHLEMMHSMVNAWDDGEASATTTGGGGPEVGIASRVPRSIRGDAAGAGAGTYTAASFSVTGTVPSRPLVGGTVPVTLSTSTILGTRGLQYQPPPVPSRASPAVLDGSDGSAWGAGDTTTPHAGGWATEHLALEAAQMALLSAGARDATPTMQKILYGGQGRAYAQRSPIDEVFGFGGTPGTGGGTTVAGVTPTPLHSVHRGGGDAADLSGVDRRLYLPARHHLDGDEWGDTYPPHSLGLSPCVDAGQMRRAAEALGPDAVTTPSVYRGAPDDVGDVAWGHGDDAAQFFAPARRAFGPHKSAVLTSIANRRSSSTGTSGPYGTPAYVGGGGGDDSMASGEVSLNYSVVGPAPGAAPPHGLYHLAGAPGSCGETPVSVGGGGMGPFSPLHLTHPSGLGSVDGGGTHDGMVVGSHGLSSHPPPHLPLSVGSLSFTPTPHHGNGLRVSPFIAGGRSGSGSMAAALPPSSVSPSKKGVGASPAAAPAAARGSRFTPQKGTYHHGGSPTSHSGHTPVVVAPSVAHVSATSPIVGGGRGIVSPNSAYFQLERHRCHIVELSKDQLGCRALQHALESCLFHSDEVQAIYNELLPHLHLVMSDPYGNFLIQKLLDVAPDDARLQITTRVAPHLPEIATTPHGTFTVQKLVESIRTHAEELVICAGLASNIALLMADVNGGHVVLKLLHCLGEDMGEAGDAAQRNRRKSEARQFLFDGICSHVLDICNNRHGCCIVQKCMDVAKYPEQLHQLQYHLLRNLLPLASNPYGNYVLTHLFQLCENRGDRGAMDEAAGLCTAHLLQLCTNKFASNVVEKILQSCSPEAAAGIVQCLLTTVKDAQPVRKRSQESTGTSAAGRLTAKKRAGSSQHASPMSVREETGVAEGETRTEGNSTTPLAPPLLLTLLAQDQYGNYVVQTALSVAPVAALPDMVHALRPLLPLLRSLNFGKKMEGKIDLAIARLRGAYAAASVDDWGGTPPVTVTVNVNVNAANSGLTSGAGPHGYAGVTGTTTATARGPVSHAHGPTGEKSMTPLASPSQALAGVSHGRWHHTPTEDAAARSSTVHVSPKLFSPHKVLTPLQGSRHADVADELRWASRRIAGDEAVQRPAAVMPAPGHAAHTVVHTPSAGGSGKPHVGGRGSGMTLSQVVVSPHGKK